MRNLILTLIAFTFISCQNSKNDTVIEGIEECNRVEFYRISKRQMDMVSNDTINRMQSLHEILSYNDQSNADYSKIISVLDKYYVKYNVNEDSSNDILNEFTGWKIPEITIFAQACAPLYRDIVVFKKDNKIIGVAKVCFDCSQNYLIVNKAVAKDVKLDYEDLKTILDELASS